RPGRERETMGSRGILSARDREQVHRVIGTEQPTQDVAVHRGKLHESGILQAHCHSDDPQRSVTTETKMRIMTGLFISSLMSAACVDKSRQGAAEEISVHRAAATVSGPSLGTIGGAVTVN